MTASHVRSTQIRPTVSTPEAETALRPITRICRVTTPHNFVADPQARLNAMPLCMVCDELTDVPFDGDGVARCPRCDTVAAARASIPLFIVCGTMGSGKSTIVPPLREKLADCLVFDGDLILSYFDDWDRLRGAWLMVGWAIAQQQRATVLCTPMPPSVIEHLPERRFWSSVRYLNLHCSDDERAARLRARPAWRASNDEDFIEEMNQYARRLLAEVEVTVDSTGRTVDSVACDIAAWVNKSLGRAP